MKAQSTSGQPIPVVLICLDICHVLVASLISVELGKRRAILNIASKEKLN